MLKGKEKNSLHHSRIKRWFDKKSVGKNNFSAGDLVLKWDKAHHDKGKHTKFSLPVDWVIHRAWKAWSMHLSSWSRREDWLSTYQWPRLETIFLMKIRGCALHYVHSISFCCLSICLNFVLVSIMWRSFVHEYVVASKYVCGWTIKRIVTLQRFASLLSVFFTSVTSFWLMKFWRKIWFVCKENFGPTMNLCLAREPHA